jgi:hypothetical protein
MMSVLFELIHQFVTLGCYKSWLDKQITVKMYFNDDLDTVIVFYKTHEKIIILLL